LVSTTHHIIDDGACCWGSIRIGPMMPYSAAAEANAKWSAMAGQGRAGQGRRGARVSKQSKQMHSRSRLEQIRFNTAVLSSLFVVAISISICICVLLKRATFRPPTLQLPSPFPFPLLLVASQTKPKTPNPSPNQPPVSPDLPPVTQSTAASIIQTSQYNPTQPNPVQYNTIQYNTLRYNTVQYESRSRKLSPPWIRCSRRTHSPNNIHNSPPKA
jgi:hypothetical protein